MAEERDERGEASENPGSRQPGERRGLDGRSDEQGAAEDGRGIYDFTPKHLYISP
jgi:hypothetical protein